MKQTSLKPWHESYEAEAWVICAPLIARSQSTPESLSLMMFFSDSVTDDSICSEPRFSTGIKENYHFVPSENSYQKGSRSDYHAEKKKPCLQDQMWKVVFSQLPLREVMFNIK